MNATQYERFVDFATRAARTWFKGHKNPDPEWIQDAVANFIDSIAEEDIGCIVDWDKSEPYPEGHRWHGTDCYGRASRPYCMGDMMSEWDDYVRYDHSLEWPGSGRHWYDVAFELELYDVADEIAWDSVDHYMSPVACCVRSALDMASAPSAGVIGFTAGDIRAMYPEGVPEWVFPPGERLRYWLTDELNGTFEDLPDSAGVVL